jgi:hypothetical protein
MIYITKQNHANIYKTNIVTSIENSFVYELSFLFYIALTRKLVFGPLLRMKIYFPLGLLNLSGTVMSKPIL